MTVSINIVHLQLIIISALRTRLIIHHQRSVQLFPWFVFPTMENIIYSGRVI